MITNTKTIQTIIQTLDNWIASNYVELDEEDDEQICWEIGAYIQGLKDAQSLLKKESKQNGSTMR